MEQVFISYARADHEIANQIQDMLSRAGFGFWWDHELQAGTEWKSQIDEALHSSSHLIAILSPRSIKSPYVTSEYRFFLSQNKPVIPVLAGDISDDEIPLSLQGLQFVDLRKSSPEAMARLIQAVRTSGTLESQNIKKTPEPKKNALKLTLNLDISEVSSEKLRDIVAKLAEAGVEEIEVVNVGKAS